VDSSDPCAIGEAVNRLLSDDQLREEMAKKAREARERYSWRREEKVLLDLYADLLADLGAA
jgi:glycosyltransferase involved in cell wall biosynthesis